MTISNQQNTYLESKVLTATSHKLHLMLIDGAIRFGRQAEEAMRSEDFDAASEPMMRVIDIIGEMLAGVRDSTTDLNQKLAKLYLFLFRCVSEARVNDDAEKLTEALRLFEFERETWRLVCEKMDSGEMDGAQDLGSTSGNSKTRSSVGPHFIDVTPSAASFDISSEA